jgi:hypothetical protein
VMPRHNRIDVILPAAATTYIGDRTPVLFDGRVTNVSRGGLCLSCPHGFPPGKLIRVDMVLSAEGKKPEPISLFGATRWLRSAGQLGGGFLIGIELLMDERVADYGKFRRWVARPSSPRRNAGKNAAPRRRLKASHRRTAYGSCQSSPIPPATAERSVRSH